MQIHCLSCGTQELKEDFGYPFCEADISRVGVGVLEPAPAQRGSVPESARRSGKSDYRQLGQLVIERERYARLSGS